MLLGRKSLVCVGFRGRCRLGNRAGVNRGSVGFLERSLDDVEGEGAFKWMDRSYTLISIPFSKSSMRSSLTTSVQTVIRLWRRLRIQDLPLVTTLALYSTMQGRINCWKREVSGYVPVVERFVRAKQVNFF